MLERTMITLGFIVALATVVVFIGTAFWTWNCPWYTRWPSVLGNEYPQYIQAEVEGRQKSIDASEAASQLSAGDNVLIVVGYGAFIAQAQSALTELANELVGAGKNVFIGVNSCEARGRTWVYFQFINRPRAPVLGFDAVNQIISSVDVAFVIGANDMVNPIGNEPNSPLAGFPVFEVWHAKQIIVSKRGQGTGYSGVLNPLFFRSNTRMLYGDGKASVEDLLRVVSTSAPMK